MRLLEVRFHPETKSRRTFVIVGRVRCDPSGASIERADVPPDAVKPFDSRRLLEKLEFLVASVVGDRARALLELQSGFWSFVELAEPDPPADPGLA